MIPGTSEMCQVQMATTVCTGSEILCQEFGLNHSTSYTTMSTTEPTGPGALQALQATSISGNVTWSAPQDLGGAALTGYQVTRDNEIVIETTTSAAFAYIDCGVHALVSQRSYKVALLHTAGKWGEASSLTISSPSATMPTDVELTSAGTTISITTLQTTATLEPLEVDTEYPISVVRCSAFELESTTHSTIGW